MFVKLQVDLVSNDVFGAVFRLVKQISDIFPQYSYGEELYSTEEYDDENDEIGDDQEWIDDNEETVDSEENEDLAVIDDDDAGTVSEEILEPFNDPIED